ncbi:Alcohol dehydrogenase superfamily zinc-containing, partial [Macrophomina phaseolina MS6]
YAKALGMCTIAVDIGSEKEKMCRNLGADQFIDAASGQDIAEEVRRIVQYGAHGVVVATLAEEAYELAPCLLRPRGTMVAVAFPKSLTYKAGANPILIAQKMVRYNSDWPDFIYDFIYLFAIKINIVGSTTGTRREMDEVLDFTVQGVVRPVINKGSLSDLDELMDTVMQGKLAGKVVLQI